MSVNDLSVAFKNLNQINDYTSFPTRDESLKKLSTEKLPFVFGTDIMNIKMNDDLTYTIFDNSIKVCGICLVKYKKNVSDCECIKSVNIGTKPQLFISRRCDVCFGLYSDTSIEFDIFVDNRFIHHYVLEPGIFSPLYNENNKNIACVSLNIRHNYAWEIRNIKTDTNPFNLILLNTDLRYDDLRMEMADSKIVEFIL
jgi:hypothetical protein